MSTTSPCQPPTIKQLGSVTVRKCVNSRAKTLSSTNPVFPGNVAAEVAGVGFPRVRNSIWESCRRKVYRTVARAWFALQNDTGMLGALLEGDVGKMCTRLSWELDFTQRNRKNLARSEPPPICVVESALTLRKRWSIWCDAPVLCGFATGCDKTHWHGFAQRSMTDAAMLLAIGIAAGGR